LGAKLRKIERKAKLVWAFPSESNFDGVKVTKNRAKSKRKTRLSVAIPRWSNFDGVKVTKKTQESTSQRPPVSPGINIV